MHSATDTLPPWGPLAPISVQILIPNLFIGRGSSRAEGKERQAIGPFLFAFRMSYMCVH